MNDSHPVFRFAKTVRRHLPFQRQLFSALRMLNPPERVYQHLPITGWITIKTQAGRFRMFSNGDVVENAIFWSRDGRGQDAISFQVWERIASLADGAILDIGANTGLYALIAKTEKPRATVMAFEPVSRIAEKLSRNIAGNGYDIAVVRKAISDRNGNATFHDSADPASSTNGYSASLENSFAFNDHSYEVEVATLDSLLPPDQKISLIKIDVELHEVAAVRGMMAIIERDRPSLLIEILNDDIGNTLSAILQPFGYRFYRIEEQRGMHRSDKLGALSGHNFNNLACTDEIIDLANLKKFYAEPGFK